MATDLTWLSGADTTVTAAAAIDSDPFDTSETVGFSLVVDVNGLGPNGISGNLQLAVSNTGAPGSFVDLPGSQYAVAVGAGQILPFIFSFSTYYAFVLLRWVQAGIGDAGTLGIGFWNSSALPTSPPPPNPPASGISILAQATGLQSTIDYGTDIYCLNDLDPNFATVTGQGVLVQAALHRLSTPRGTFRRHPNDGLDLRQYLNGDIDVSTTADTGAIASAVQTELPKDERFQSCQCSASFDDGADTLTLELSITPSIGPSFSMVVAITALSVKLVQVN